jgi:hypothetical protein
VTFGSIRTSLGAKIAEKIEWTKIPFLFKILAPSIYFGFVAPKLILSEMVTEIQWKGNRLLPFLFG